MKRENQRRIAELRNEEAAYRFVERWIWPDGPVCPHCSSKRRIRMLGGVSTRIHTYKCYDCRKPFTVKLGTIFMHSKIPMRKWVQLILLKRSLGSQLNAHQASRILGITSKTAAAMLERLRKWRLVL